MKYYLSLSLIIVFIGLSVFGFLAFNHDMANENGGCFASNISGTVCPLDVINFVLHHVLALQIFSQALLSSSFDLLISLIIISFLLPLWLWWRHHLLPPPHQFTSSRKRNFGVNFRLNQLKFIHWLALFEQSPAL